MQIKKEKYHSRWKREMISYFLYKNTFDKIYDKGFGYVSELFESVNDGLTWQHKWKHESTTIKYLYTFLNIWFMKYFVNDSFA